MNLRKVRPIENEPESPGGSESPESLLRILIVDDHAIMRQGLRELLAEEFRHATFGEAENGSQALSQVAESTWDVALLDITMPGQNGLEVLRPMLEIQPRLAVLILSMHAEEQFAIRALKLGATGYVSKNTASKDVVGAVRKVLGGGKYISASLAETLADGLSTPVDRPGHETLSHREYQVLRQLASGKLVKEIAFELGLSVKTISTYRTRILEKMKFTSNSEIIRYALLNKLVD